MHTIIAGGGNTGRKLIELFRNHPRHRITVIEADPKKCELISEMFPHVEIVLGKAMHPSSLKEALHPKTSAFIAVTGEDYKNLLAAKAAKNLGIPKVILRVGEPEYLDLCKLMGLENVLDPTDSISAQVVTRLTGVDISQLIHKLHLDIELRQVTTEERPDLVDAAPDQFAEIMGDKFYPILVQRGNKYYLPSEIKIFKSHDQIIMWVREKY